MWVPKWVHEIAHKKLENTHVLKITVESFESYRQQKPFRPPESILQLEQKVNGVLQLTSLQAAALQM